MRVSQDVPFDPNGNLTSKTENGSTWGYEWNAEHQLVKVTKDGSEVARFAYDPLGGRVEKVVGGVTTTYAYDNEDILRETSVSRAYTYIHGLAIDEPLAREGEGAPTYYHADALGSVVVTTDQTGTISQSYRYDAWGNLEMGAADAGYAFTGREWDPETGLYHYRARYYMPEAARFASEDPIGLSGGDVDLYRYVFGNPTRFQDPDGLAALDPPAGTKWCGPTTANMNAPMNPAAPSGPQGPECCDEPMKNVVENMIVYCIEREPCGPYRGIRGKTQTAGIDYTDDEGNGGGYYTPSGNALADHCVCVHETNHLQNASHGRCKNFMECIAYSVQMSCLAKSCPRR